MEYRICGADYLKKKSEFVRNVKTRNAIEWADYSMGDRTKEELMMAMMASQEDKDCYISLSYAAEYSKCWDEEFIKDMLYAGSGLAPSPSCSYYWDPRIVNFVLNLYLSMDTNQEQKNVTEEIDYIIDNPRKSGLPFDYVDRLGVERIHQVDARRIRLDEFCVSACNYVYKIKELVSVFRGYCDDKAFDILVNAAKKVEGCCWELNRFTTTTRNQTDIEAYRVKLQNAIEEFKEASSLIWEPVVNIVKNNTQTKEDENRFSTLRRNLSETIGRFIKKAEYIKTYTIRMFCINKSIRNRLDWKMLITEQNLDREFCEKWARFPHAEDKINGYLGEDEVDDEEEW